MSNPFSGIITSEFKQTYINAIDALLEDAALTVPCSIYYDSYKYEDCSVCVASDLGDRGGAPFSPGGSNILPNTQNCPVCGGTGKRRVEVAPESINLLVIFDYKKWIDIGRMTDTVQTPEGFVQILSKSLVTPKLRKAKYLILDTDIGSYASHRFVKDGEPAPLGLGDNEYTLSMWKREA